MKHWIGVAIALLGAGAWAVIAGGHLTDDRSDHPHAQLAIAGSTTICDSFETLYLSEMVDTMLENETPETKGFSETDHLVVVALSIRQYCPHRLVFFVNELEGQYPSWIQQDVDNLFAYYIYGD